MPVDRLKNLGLSAPQLLLPSKGHSLQLWPVNACDQHVHDFSYWQRARQRVGNSPSTLSLILPEVHIFDNNWHNRIPQIHARMREFANEGILSPVGNGLVKVTYTHPGRPSRMGVLLLFDLEAWHQPVLPRTAVRPTEACVLERIPPRLAIRQHAALDVSHGLVLMDDPNGVLEATLCSLAGSHLYEIDLPESEGTISGSLIQSPEEIESLVSNLELLAENAPHDAPLWFVGDGNHSFESARQHWSQTRTSIHSPHDSTHPARYFLAELTALQSPGIRILPVHRQIQGLGATELLSRLRETGLISQACNIDTLRADLESPTGQWTCGITSAEITMGFRAEYSAHTPFLNGLDEILQELEEKFPSVRIDYLHGWEELGPLSEQSCAVLVRGETSHSLLNSFRNGGVFPRKSFSLGTFREKRHYMEVRKFCA